MPFSQATITSVAPPVFQNGFAILSWTSSSPAGTWYQIYVDGALVDWTQNTSATVATSDQVESVDIGTVGSGEQMTDFSASIAGFNRFAELSWLGGTFESENIAGFYVYMSSVAGGPISFTKPIATVTAYPQGILLDGFGYGGFGDGGFGASAAAYGWTSEPLTFGLWSFAVKPFDTAGNIGAGLTTTVQINVPPIEPARFPIGDRLHYTFSSGSETATLTWEASPSA